MMIKAAQDLILCYQRPDPNLAPSFRTGPPRRANLRIGRSLAGERPPGSRIANPPARKSRIVRPVNPTAKGTLWAVGAAVSLSWLPLFFLYTHTGTIPSSGAHGSSSSSRGIGHGPGRDADQGQGLDTENP